MKLKLIVMDLELSPRTKRFALRLGVPAVLLGMATVAYADVPNIFTSGEILTAASLNANFAYHDKEIDNLNATALTTSGGAIAGTTSPTLSVTNSASTNAVPVVNALAVTGGVALDHVAINSMYQFVAESFSGCGSVTNICDCGSLGANWYAISGGCGYAGCASVDNPVECPAHWNGTAPRSSSTNWACVGSLPSNVNDVVAGSVGGGQTSSDAGFVDHGPSDGWACNPGSTGSPTHCWAMCVHSTD